MSPEPFSLETCRGGLVLADAPATQALARWLASVLPANTVLLLDGPMGAGKTTFVQGLAKGWGIKEPVTSPTYNLYNIYLGQRQLIHLDAYRLNAPQEAEELLLEEFLQEPWALVIEWPSRLPEHWREQAWSAALTILPDHSRRFSLETEGQL